MAKRAATRKRPDPQRTNGAPDPSKVAALAYEIFLERQRTGTQGDERSDWYAAERELSRRD